MYVHKKLYERLNGTPGQHKKQRDATIFFIGTHRRTHTISTPHYTVI